MRDPALDGLSAPPGGLGWVIRHEAPDGLHEASVTQIGATLRTYTIDGRPLISGFAAEQVRPAYRGAVLMPWPNRVRDGRYSFGGTDRQLALTEPQRLTAMHGLVCWQRWEPAMEGSSRVSCETTLFPQQGWDWTLTCRMTYALDDDGLRVTAWVRNESDTAAPFGYSLHPYLTCGEASVDELELSLPAARTLGVDPERLLPEADTIAASLRDVDAATDLRAGPALAGRSLDTAYTDLRADPDGRWRAVLSHPPSGARTVLWAPATDLPWVQVFTGDALPEPARRRTGVALEPMTCGPDALATGEDLITLNPGQEWSTTWGLSG